MAFAKNKRERIKKYILEKIERKDSDFVKKVAKNFGISLTTVYRYVKELANEGIIKKEEGYYKLTSVEHKFIYHTNGRQLEEDEIFQKEVQPIIYNLPQNVQKVWAYAFTEMMNNAIEHSGAEIICGSVTRNYLDTTIFILDNGIGIFEKIKSYYNYASLDDAISELFKGKLTTDSENHSGEGIFFTSRMLDEFAAMSSGKIFTHDPHFDICKDVESIPEISRWKDEKGTTILMTLSNDSSRTTKEVFDMFSDPDEGFVKTHIPLKNIFANGYPVSRSQARRLTTRFNDFKEVVLDFEGVEDLGQGFAHELFVVFQKRNPKTKLIVENANEDVEKMINHVKNTK